MNDSKAAILYGGSNSSETVDQTKTELPGRPYDSGAGKTPEERLYGEHTATRNDGAGIYSSAFKEAQDRLLDHGIGNEGADRFYKDSAKTFYELGVPSGAAGLLHSKLVQYGTKPMSEEDKQKNNIISREQLRLKYGEEADQLLEDLNDYISRTDISMVAARGAGSDPDFVMSLVEHYKNARARKLNGL